ncbi:MAG: hypothetical protein GXO63_01075 [Candidatus Micrarchaeota archaeon]|nr:hypothetical protein [Candidatus Micrarchaeota archaeon]
MSNKSRGIKKEWLLKKELERSGYLVIRSSASKTGIDLLAAKNGRVLAFQVQSSEYIYPEKLRELEKYAEAFGAEPLVAVRKNGKWKFSAPEKLKKSGKMFKLE